MILEILHCSYPFRLVYMICSKVLSHCTVSLFTDLLDVVNGMRSMENQLFS